MSSSSSDSDSNQEDHSHNGSDTDSNYGDTKKKIMQNNSPEVTHRQKPESKGIKLTQKHSDVSQRPSSTMKRKTLQSEKFRETGKNTSKKLKSQKKDYGNDSDDDDVDDDSNNDPQDQNRDEKSEELEQAEESSDDGESEEKDDFAKIRKELSNMPFDERQRLKEKIGLKLYKQVMSGAVATTAKKGFKRQNKNRPMEVSSKRRPSRVRQVVSVKKQMTRDPRFDDLSGTYKEDIFKKTYSFIGDIRQREKQKLLEVLSEEKEEDKKAQVEYLVHRMNAQEKTEQQREQRLQREQALRKRERQLVAKGKRPFYLKSSEKKRLDLAEKYRELKKKGKVDQYLSNKRKKNATKERRNLPTME